MVAMHSSDGAVIDPARLGALRQELGASFGRMLGYFREDGNKSIRAIEDGARERSAVALVRPAHTLKGDALVFGAVLLAEAAETIEVAARQAVEDHVYPDEIVAEVVRLRPLFDTAVERLVREASPATVLRRAVGFGRKSPGRA
jgi:HPt (histidine-containing phosphotransfer) domain-containing protein